MPSLAESQKLTKFCLIAGLGELPAELTKAAKADGVEVIAFALNNEIYKNLKDITTTIQFPPVDVYGMVNKIKELGIQHISFIGKVPKLEFFKNLHKLDPKFIKFITDVEDFNDDSLHAKAVEFLNENDIEVINQTTYLKALLPGKQCFTNRKPSADEEQEIKYGLEMAKGIAALDIGQTVVVKNKSVIAVESIEGTNACIKRAAKTFGWPFKTQSVTVCKVSKPNQDQRFDVPTVGQLTIDAMPKNSILAFEANETIFVNQKEAIEKANKKNISIIAY